MYTLDACRVMITFIYDRYMVAVYDKTTGKVKLADAQMFNIRPELQGMYSECI